VTFDGSASRDPDGDPVAKYNWTLAPLTTGGIVPGTQVNASGLTLNHIFSKTGTYVVSLTVTDNHQLSSTQTAFVTVTRIAYLPGTRAGLYGKYYVSTNQTTNSQFLARAVNITQVSGSKIGSTLSTVAPNATSVITSRQTVDVYSGLGVGSPFSSIVAANLTAGDAVYPASGFLLRLNSTTTQIFAGASRIINTLRTHSSSGTTSYEFDSLTGLLVRLETNTNSVRTVLTLGDTNAWSPTLNESPIPLFSWSPNIPEPGRPVMFDATHSYDPDHDTISYAWSFGDGGTASSASPSHTYQNKGNYTVTLTVNDTLANLASASKLISVASFEPNVTIISTTPNPANTGQPVTIAFTTSSPTTIKNIGVNWGDGTTADILTGTTTSDTHTYTSTGSRTLSTFTINVTATNAAGPASATTTETVNDRPPTVTILSVSPNPTTTGELVTVKFSSTDPDGSINSYSVNWGDGKTDTGIPGIATSDNHSYNSAGTFTITVTANDNSGSTGKGTGSVKILPPSVPNLTIISLTPNPVFTSATVTVTFNVSSLAPLTGIAVNWGDGSTPDSLSLSSISDTHVYANTGSSTSQSFAVAVTATNRVGPGSKTVFETVNDRPPIVTVTSVSPNPVNITDTVTITFKASDPDGTIAAFNVDWGDTITDSLRPDATVDTHAYGSNGAYSVRVTVTDNSGSMNYTTQIIKVVIPPLTTATMTMTCSPNATMSGSSTTCSVNVEGTYPSGKVTFSANSTTGTFTPTFQCLLYFGNCSLSYTDTSIFNATALITGSYPGDTYNTEANGSFSLSILKHFTTTTTSVSCSPNTAEVGTFTSCAVTVNGSFPTGTVTFSTTSTTGHFIPSNGECSLTSGSCALTYTDTTTANTTATIRASYLGDNNNNGSNGSSLLALVRPSTTLAAATSSLTITSGAATADQTSTTGISVQITGSAATDGTPIGVNSRDLTSPNSRTAANLSGAKYYDVAVSGISSGNAKICIGYGSESSGTTMQYWNGTAWTSATGVTAQGASVCGLIPVPDLKSTSIVVGIPVQAVPSQPNNSNLTLLIVAIIVAAAVLGVTSVFFRRKGVSLRLRLPWVF
jgi:PKD repeat protein